MWTPPRIRRISGERPFQGIWFRPVLLGSVPGNLKSFFFLGVVVVVLLGVGYAASKLPH